MTIPSSFNNIWRDKFGPKVQRGKIKVNSSELHQRIIGLRIGELEVSFTLGHTRLNSTEASIIRIV